MQKILTLGVKDWITGIGVGQHLEGSGLFTTADGINPFVDPFLNSANFGLLQAGKTAVDASAGVVDEVIVHFIPRNETEMYGLGISGDIYSIATATGVPTLKIASGADAAVYSGFFSKGGGTEYFYYFYGTKVGRYDLTSGATNSFWTGLTGAIRPNHYWAGIHYFGNGQYVGQLDPSALPTTGALPVGNTQALDFDPEYTVMCLADDDYRLVIGASTQTANFTYKGQTKIYFWNGYDDSWEKEWDVPEPNIQKIYRIGSTFYAICGRALYAFNYSTPPTKILDLDTNHSLSVGNINPADRMGDALVWGNSTALSMYGKINARVPSAFTAPYQIPTSTIVSLNASISPTMIFVGANNAKLYTIDKTTGGGVATATTHYIDLKSVFNIQGITVVFGKKLASTDDVSVVITNINGDTLTVNPTYTALGATARKFYTLDMRADQVKLAITFNAGNPQIKDIILYGEISADL